MKLGPVERLLSWTATVQCPWLGRCGGGYPHWWQTRRNSHAIVFAREIGTSPDKFMNGMPLFACNASSYR